MPADAHLTTPVVWLCTGILLILDAVLCYLAWRSINPASFQKLRWRLITISGIFFLLVWTSVLWWGWDWFYAYIFPHWARYTLPPIFAIAYALLVAGMFWLSLRLPGHPAVVWCILGGVEGLLSHLYAIYGLGAAAKPPIMQGTDPFAVLIFAVFEKAFYWSLILLVCTQLWRKLSLNRGINREPG